MKAPTPSTTTLTPFTYRPLNKLLVIQQILRRHRQNVLNLISSRNVLQQALPPIQRVHLNEHPDLTELLRRRVNYAVLEPENRRKQLLLHHSCF